MRPWLPEFMDSVVRGPGGEAIFTRNPRWFAVRFAWDLRNSLLRVLKLIGQESREYTYLESQPRPRGRPRPEPVTRSWLPGYIFLRIDLDYDRWQQLYAAPGFIGYLGGPTPIREKDIADLDRLLPKRVAPRDPGLKYHTGDMVKITDGTFAGFEAKIIGVRSKSVLLITWIFGRPTETLVSIDHIEKVV